MAAMAMTDSGNEVAVRDQMVAAAAGDTASFFDALRAIGASAVELEVAPDLSLPGLWPAAGNGAGGPAPLSLGSGPAIAAARARFDAENVRVTALMLATDFSGDDADAHVEWAVRAAHAAADLGASALRIDTWTRRTGELPPGTIVDNLARRLGRVLDATDGTGVALGIENHGRLFNDPEILDAVFTAVDDPRVGMTLDTGNFYWYGHPLSRLYALLEHFAPRARHTHIKNIAYPPELAETRREIGYEYGRYAAPLDEGNIDITRVVGILRGAGYRGDLCVENEALSRYDDAEQRINILRRDVEALRAALRENAA
jgi:sugar phosphate isomerase/epimerase